MAKTFKCDMCDSDFKVVKLAVIESLEFAKSVGEPYVCMECAKLEFEQLLEEYVEDTGDDHETIHLDVGRITFGDQRDRHAYLVASENADSATLFEIVPGDSDNEIGTIPLNEDGSADLDTVFDRLNDYASLGDDS